MKNIVALGGKYIVKKLFPLPTKRTDEEYQYSLMRSFVRRASGSIIGKRYAFSPSRTRDDFQRIIPLQHYDAMQHDIECALQGASNHIRPGKIPFFSKSSGTTARSKFIPITKEALKKNHYAAGKEVFSRYLHAREESMLLLGKWLIMGGRLTPNPFDPWVTNVGDVSAILQENAPRYTKLFRKPSPKVSFMEHFDTKLDAMIAETKDEDITFLAGVPSWLTLFLQRLVDTTWAKDVFEIWPNLELFLWGGISIEPYTQQLAQLLPWDKVRYRQNYNASEWFFAFQDMYGVDDMLLATQHHVLYEFISLTDIKNLEPRALLCHQVLQGSVYELVITTDGWLWRYRTGDLVQITGINPIRVRVAGRTKSFLNMFGEEVMEHSTDEVIRALSVETWRQIADYVVTSVREKDGWYHHRYIDITGPEGDADESFIATFLDRAIQAHNSDYAAKRTWDILMQSLRITLVPSWMFHSYLEDKGKLGGQHKLKRLWNDRDALMQEIGSYLPA
jgi:GH3 auxin-responsive promoter